MTATDVWALLVRDDVPADVHRALDMVMESGGEREEAVRLLREAAGAWAHRMKIKEFGYDIGANTPSSTTDKAWRDLAAGNFEGAEVYIRFGEQFLNDSFYKYGIHVKRALAILREIQSLHEALA